MNYFEQTYIEDHLSEMETEVQAWCTILVSEDPLSPDEREQIALMLERHVRLFRRMFPLGNA